MNENWIYLSKTTEISHEFKQRGAIVLENSSWNISTWHCRKVI